MPRIRAESIEAHKQLTRREILEATRSLLAEVGSADISLGEVAAQVGIGRTTLYEYFRDKDDLIASLVEETLPDVVAELLAAVPEDLPPAQRLARLAGATLEFLVTDGVLGLILHRELPRLSAHAQDRIRLAHSDLGREMGAIYSAGVESGAFRRLPPDLAARLIHDVIMSAARAVIAAPDPAARLEEIVKAMTEFLLHGLTG